MKNKDVYNEIIDLGKKLDGIKVFYDGNSKVEFYIIQDDDLVFYADFTPELYKDLLKYDNIFIKTTFSGGKNAGYTLMNIKQYDNFIKKLFTKQENKDIE